MDLGYRTKMMIIGSCNQIRMAEADYDELATAGKITKGYWDSSGGSVTLLPEDKVIDLGIVTNETEDLSAGGIAISVPTKPATSRYNWSVGGRVLRVTITGIIPDGIYYVATGDSATNKAKYEGKSNASVFRLKVNEALAYSSLWGGSNNSRTPNTIQYRRAYLSEKDKTGYSGTTSTSELGSYVITNYNLSLIEGTRHLQYTMTLDFSNDVFGGTQRIDPGDYIAARNIGDV